MLTRNHILHYIPRKKTPYIIYTRERQERVHLSREVYEDRKESYVNRIKAMIEYATAEEKCRSRMLLDYFGEKNEHNCGQCDVCLQKKATKHTPTDSTQLRESILQLLAESPCPAATIADKLPSDKEEVSKMVSFLLSEEIIHLKDGILFS